MTDRRCLTPDEYALEHKVSRKTVYRLISRGIIPAERIGQQWRIWVRSKPIVGQRGTP